MHNEDEDLDALYDALLIEKTIINALAPPTGGYAYESIYYSTYVYQYRFDINWGWSVHPTKSHLTDILYLNDKGVPHRLYGPAYISEHYKVEMWYKDGVVHRDNGPAITHKLNQIWISNGRLHRLDGPAIVDQARPKEYWIMGIKFSPKEYKREINRRKRKGLI